MDVMEWTRIDCHAESLNGPFATKKRGQCGIHAMSIERRVKRRCFCRKILLWWHEYPAFQKYPYILVVHIWTEGGFIYEQNLKAKSKAGLCVLVWLHFKHKQMHAHMARTHRESISCYWMCWCVQQFTKGLVVLHQAGPEVLSIPRQHIRQPALLTLSSPGANCSIWYAVQLKIARPWVGLNH